MISAHPRVVTLHDLAWAEHKEGYPSRLRRIGIGLQARWSARHSDVVLTVSNYARDRIIDEYEVEPERVLVAPNAVDPVFSPERAGVWSVGAPYIVALGGARRRGLEVAIAAWRRVCAGSGESFKLVVVGQHEQITGEGIINAGVVDDTTWASILAGAAAFCYPTRYEGFGMPALEAAASGTPVVCSRVTSLPEILGDAAEWSETSRVDDFAAALHRVLMDPSRRQELSAAGLARVANGPTWADSARVVLEAYRLAAR